MKQNAIPRPPPPCQNAPANAAEREMREQYDNESEKR